MAKAEIVYYGPASVVCARARITAPADAPFLVYVVGSGLPARAARNKNEARTWARVYGATHYCKVVGL